MSSKPIVTLFKGLPQNMTPADEVLLKNQWNALKMVVKEAALKKLGNTSKRVKEWISAAVSRGRRSPP